MRHHHIFLAEKFQRTRWLQSSISFLEVLVSVFTRKNTCKLRALPAVFLAVLAGCQSVPKQSVTDDTRKQIAQALQDSGDYGNAAVVRSQVSKKGRETPDDLLILATAAVAMGQVDEGMQEAQEALKARGDDLPFALEVGRLAIRAGRLNMAEAVYAQILRTHPDSVQALNGKGVVLAQKGDLGGAIVALRTALARDPHDVPASANLALALLLKGDNVAAAALLQDLDRTDGSPRIKAELAMAKQRLHYRGATVRQTSGP